VGGGQKTELFGVALRLQDVAFHEHGGGKYRLKRHFFIYVAYGTALYIFNTLCINTSMDK